ncbi:hypothetical protein D9753_19995 [Streptomyces dangxiongensis]|uniref:Uncharacterized protein n=1 Tax=Streptomyces dangxiongensis TaxID=1442032 RepID=A0A3G2JEL2_9ACTN|nr:hypothetical protein [Streptomyces dangxiongensis]AYN40786.1 hypothetical protein D9753_19995 [Streptomyces dangxiongensis]
MTQSGQGEEPSARPAREGIVLPSDGGEPLLPGTTGTPAPAAPAGGQAWGGPRGPERQAPQPDQGLPPVAAPQWGTPDGSGPQSPPPGNPGPLPPEGAPAPSYGGRTPSYGAQAPAYGPGGQPPTYGSPAGPDAQYYGGQNGPAGQGGQQYGGQNGPAGQGAQQYGAQGDPAGQGGQQYGGPQSGGYGVPQQPPYGTPGPYGQPQPQHPQSQQHPQSPQHPQYPAAGAPLPPMADGATQYLPPIPAGPADEGATQYIPPVQAAPADQAATQYLPPVPPGTAPSGSAGEQTRYLGHGPRPAAPAHSDAEATQYIPPYAAQAQAAGGDRQPPAEFDNLFRGGPAGDDSPAGSTQQLPRVPDPHPGPAQAPYRPARPSYGPEADDEGGRRRGRSRLPLIAAIGIGLVVLGVGAGALLSGGGGKDGGTDDKTAASAPPTTHGSASPTVDPARQQAVDLDKLLADSGSSRASVIQAVTDVRRCDNLDRAAADLRDAAKQRGGLVTRLGSLSVDELPGSGDLTAALTSAWQASAAADNHYAVWADQAKNRKVCHKGHARTTGETQAGNRESGTASAQKAKAAALWNTIARKYGLTQRQPTQL